MKTDPTSSPSAASEEAPRRADAIRNREKVLAAAEEVFSEQGIEAGIPEIAERAGVGKGTIYRNFESKDDLVSAILIRRMSRFDEDIVTALAGEDAGTALREALTHAARRASNSSFLASLDWAGSSSELDEVKARVKSHMAELVEKAQRVGAIREDAKAEELWILFGGTCRALREAGEADPQVWQRHTELVMDAFRPSAG